MTAPLPFPVATRCGYCLRHLVVSEQGFECPRCAPLLVALPGFRQYASTLAAFERFAREAWADRDRSVTA